MRRRIGEKRIDEDESEGSLGLFLGHINAFYSIYFEPLASLLCCRVPL